MGDCAAHLVGGKVSFVTGIVLAGGKSLRMGGLNKALLEVGGRSIIERTISVLDRIFRNVIIVTNSPEEYRFIGKPMFGDLKPGKGSLGGLYTGLHFCASQFGFLIGCDMPFLDESVIRYMVSLLGNQDVVAPLIHGLFEPLHAIYSRRCLPHIEQLLDAEDLKIINLFPAVDVVAVPEEDLARFDPDLRCLVNLNSPEDLEKAQRLAQ